MKDARIAVEYVDLSTLKPYERNARRHEVFDVAAIKASIEEFGFNDPIGIWKDTIVEGHGRLLAAQELGLKKVPVIHLDHLFGEVRTSEGRLITSDRTKRLLRRVQHGETRLADALKRDVGQDSLFSHRTIWDDKVCVTITSGGSYIRMCDETYFSDGDFINVQTFPQDYDFGKAGVQYVTGMSVPPNMMAHVAEEITRQWFE